MERVNVFRGVLLAVVLLAVAATLITVFVVAVVRRWQSGQVNQPTRVLEANVTTSSSYPHMQYWRQRLDELHYLLLQVTASDSTLTALPGLPITTSEQLREYFQGHKTAPTVSDDQVVARVMRLEDWVLAVHTANNEHPALSPLPRSLARGIDEYVENRQRRLGA